MKDGLSKEMIHRLQRLIARETGSPLGKEAEAEMAAIVRHACGDVEDRSAEPSFLPCNVTIMFADLRGFTSITSTFPAGMVISMLNRCLGRMSEIVSRHHGVIDKFMGDSLMVLFGIPVEREDDVRRALTCAVEMQIAMTEINLDRPEGMPELFMGIGINTGNVMAGKFGTTLYSEYTVIGDEVNLTSRIEAFSLRGQILISENTHAYCGDFGTVSEPMEVYVKGKSLPVKLRELCAIPSLNLDVPRKEVRRSHRVEVRIPCQIKLVKDKYVIPMKIDATLRDIGYHGVQVETRQQLALLNEVKLEFDLPLVEFKVSDLYAKVVNSKQEGDRHLAGLEFTSISPEANMKIQLLVQLLVTEAAA